MNYKKFIIVISFLAIFGLTFNFSAPTAQAMTVAELQRLMQQIEQLQAQVVELQRQIAARQTQPDAWCHNFNINLRHGDSGQEVRALQTALEKQDFYERVITGNFDEYTAAAVVAFQEKYRENILAPSGLPRGTGFVGPATRAKLNELFSCDRARLPRPILVPPISAPSITVFSPNGGEMWVAGNRHDITWRSVGDIGMIDIVLIDHRAGPRETVIATNVPALTGRHSWVIPRDITLGDTAFTISIRGRAIEDSSNRFFSIVSPQQAPLITVLSPNGGERWVVGGTHTLRWTSDTESGRVVIDILDDRGKSVDAGIPPVIPNMEAMEWTIPSTLPAGRYKMKIMICPINATHLYCVNADLGKYGYDVSNDYFSIVGGLVPVVAPSITVLSPNGGERWVFGQVNDITWKSSGVKNAYIHLSSSNGATCRLAVVPAEQGRHSIRITENQMCPRVIAAGQQYKILIVTESKEVQDESDRFFSIVSPQQAPLITVLSPNGGERWVVGGTHTLRWTSDTESGRVVIDILDDRGKSVDAGIPPVIPNMEAMEWTIPSTLPAGRYKMKIMICPINATHLYCVNADLGKYGYDVSNDYFNVVR